MRDVSQVNHDFDVWWREYPMKVGKLAARKSYARAIKNGATPIDLMIGLQRYVRTKPDYANYCYPVTWLNQGRWLDDTTDAPLSAGELAFARTVMRKRHGRCHHDPACADPLACLNAIAYEIRATRTGVA